MSRTSAVRTYTAFGAVVRTSQASLVSKPGAPATLRLSCAFELRCMLAAALTRAQTNDRQAAGRAARRGRAAQRWPPPDAHVRNQACAHGHVDLRAHTSCHPQEGRKQARRRRAAGCQRPPHQQSAWLRASYGGAGGRTNAAHPHARYAFLCRFSRELWVTPFPKSAASNHIQCRCVR